MMLAACALALVTQLAVGQQPPPGGGKDAPAAKQKADQKSPSPAAQKQQPVLAIVGGDVYTVSREVIRRGTVLVQGDKIIEVGDDVQVPEGARVIDAAGKYVTPGFIAMNMSRIGFRSSSSRSAKLEDYLDPFDRDIKLALGVGITAGCVQFGSTSSSSRGRAPGERFLGLEPELPPLPEHFEFNPDFGDPDQQVCPCCGLPILPADPAEPATSSASSIASGKYAVLKLAFGELEPMLVSHSPFYALSSSSLAGSLNRHNWRQSIEKARQYLADRAAHEKAVKAGKKVQPPRKTVSDDLLRLVQGETYLRTSADTADDIRDMIALAKQLDYKLMLDGVAEGWLTAPELGEAGVPVIYTPRRRRSPIPGREDQSGSSIETPGILQRAGVPFAMGTLFSSISLVGLAGRDLTSLPLEAAFAVRGGCSERTALAALTVVPAQMLGLADRLGTIEKGKDADLLILDGPPLDYRSYVETAIVAGKVRYDRHKDQVYPVFDRATLK